MDQNKIIARSIKSMVADINAEVVVADLRDNGMGYEEFLLKHDGLFKRNYTKDIIDAYYDMLNSLIVLHVSRDSLYDVLPHGLFHHMFSDFESDKRVSEFVKLKKEEEYARKFFIPFDYSFFIQYVEIELALRKYFNNPTQFFEDLLLMDNNVPQKHAVKLASYMLFAEMIIGNPELTASVLSDIVEEEIQYAVFLSDEKQSLFDNDLISEDMHLGESLGINYICGESLSESRNVWEFSVILSDAKSVENYITNGRNSVNSLIKLFYDYFVPYEVEVRTKISCRQQSSLSLEVGELKIVSQEIANSYLGFNTVI